MTRLEQAWSVIRGAAQAGWNALGLFLLIVAVCWLLSTQALKALWRSRREKD